MKKHFLRRVALLMAVLSLLTVFTAGCGEEQTPVVDPEKEEILVQPEPVEIPVDFEAVQGMWPDAYALICVPNATRCSISDAKNHSSTLIVQHQTDDGYYLYRNLDGEDAKSGALYTEKTYNATDMNDPVTIIYGHNMANRTMFGGLQSYAETLKFDDDAVIYIYQPGRQLTYRIFAGIPYDTSHVMYYHDFKDEKVFNDFFQALGKAADDPAYKNAEAQNAFYSAEGCVNVDKDNLPVAGDKVIILATCKNGDNNHRYFIMAKLVEDSAAPVVMTKAEAEAAGISEDRILPKTDDVTDGTADTAEAAATTETDKKTETAS